MSDDWDVKIDSGVKMLKNHPEALKNLYRAQMKTGAGKDAPNGSVDQIIGFVDYLSTFEEATLRSIFRWGKAMYDAYIVADKKTYGYAKWVVLLVFLFLAYYFLKIIWVVAVWLIRTVWGLISGATSSAGSKNSAFEDVTASGPESAEMEF